MNDFKLTRCSWAQNKNTLMQQYHDTEWGRPCFSDQQLFELFSLEIMQAGLSWQTILNKRQALRQAFADFDYQQVRFFAAKVPELLQNAAIIRNRRKITAIINNAQIIAQLHAKHQTFAAYLWQFVGNQPIQHHFTSNREIPASDTLSQKISRQMKKDGFKFAGPVVVYSLLQAAGLVNDHETNCFLYKQIQRESKK